MVNTLETRYTTLNARIAKACQQAGRDRSAVELLAVSKTRSTEEVRALAALGQQSFGENYVSEAVDKITALPQLTWHFIGPLQSNKSRIVAEHFDWLHSLDRARLVDRLNAQRDPARGPLNVLIQVNLDGETQKAGCAPQDIAGLAEQVAAADHLRLRGLMAIPAPRQQWAEQIEVFQRLYRLFETLGHHHPHVDTLSAGMSDDLEAAIHCGATLIRVGTALFGPRPSH
jgi:pyridoxal phosphate enzyme (YggS family)